MSFEMNAWPCLTKSSLTSYCMGPVYGAAPIGSAAAALRLRVLRKSSSESRHMSGRA
jgi:hypothetical protein